MNNNKIILHLSLIKDFGSLSIVKLIQHCKANNIELEQIYGFTHANFQHAGFTFEKSLLIMKGLKDTALLDKELALLDQKDIKYVTIVDQHYPELLSQIYAPPAVLYIQGTHVDILSGSSLAVVGARACDEYGKQVIQELLPACIAQGITIVSGGALGIDTIAHQTTVDNHGSTVVVLGSGLLKPYPFSNKKLFEQVIEQKGLIISSYPLQAEPVPGNFPARNRIIAGLATTTLVVQAAEKSGALITAYYALEQGKNVAAVPGTVFDLLSVGCNNLIKQGAYLINAPRDLLILFDINYQESVAPSGIVKKQITKKEVDRVKSTQFTDEQQKIIACCKQRACTTEEIIDLTGLSIDSVNAELFTLECLGVIQNSFLHWEIR